MDCHPVSVVLFGMVSEVIVGEGGREEARGGLYSWYEGNCSHHIRTGLILLLL